MISERKRDPRHLPSAKERKRTTEPLKKGEAGERKDLKRAVEDLDGGGKRDD